MTKRDVLGIALKILGIYMLVGIVAYLAKLPMTILIVMRGGQWYPMPPWFVGLLTGLPILSIAAAYIVLRWGDVIASRLVPEDSQLSPIGTPDWERPVFVLSLRIAGVMCLIRGLQEWPRFIVPLVYGVRPARVASWEVIAAVIPLLLGGYLISGGKHLVQFLFRQPESAHGSLDAP